MIKIYRKLMRNRAMRITLAIVSGLGLFVIVGRMSSSWLPDTPAWIWLPISLGITAFVFVPVRRSSAQRTLEVAAKNMIDAGGIDEAKLKKMSQALGLTEQEYHEIINPGSDIPAEPSSRLGKGLKAFGHGFKEGIKQYEGEDLDYKIQTTEMELANKRVSHVLHLLLSIITVGIWIIIWVLVTISVLSEKRALKQKLKKLYRIRADE